jgi:membrane protein required for colicin V production
MSWLDVVIIVLIAISVFLGLKAGIIKMLFILAGIIVGVALAGHFSGSLSGTVRIVPNHDTARVFAFIFIAVMVVAIVAAVLVKWKLPAVMLGWVNRLGGAILGLFVGFVFCGAVLMLFDYEMWRWLEFIGFSHALEGSLLARVLFKGFPVVLELLSRNFESVRFFFRVLRSKLH